jgi:DNA-binding NtrC family response regulator
MIDLDRLFGTSPAMSALREGVFLAALSDAKILVTGESGVGKELVARAIHQSSRRSHAPLVTVNCAGFPDALLESELFGHVRGSFTGAYRDKPGIFERAHGGTAFLDELGEMSLRMQALLLRFLETGETHRVGGDGVHTHVDVRLIAATNRNLSERMEGEHFRQDLYYRLNVIHLQIPPLRERVDEIPVLVNLFLREFGARHSLEPPRISSEALEAMMSYGWPGNVRELRNVMEWLTIRVRRDAIGIDDLPAGIASQVRASAPAPVAAAPPPPSNADLLYNRMVVTGESFWSAVYAPFMSRDLTRTDLRAIIGKGLEQTRGSYKLLVQLFNMDAQDYKRFLNFLRKHHCHVTFQKFRTTKVPLPPHLSQEWPAAGPQ